MQESFKCIYETKNGKICSIDELKNNIMYLKYSFIPDSLKDSLPQYSLEYRFL